MATSNVYRTIEEANQLLSQLLSEVKDNRKDNRTVVTRYELFEERNFNELKTDLLEIIVEKLDDTELQAFNNKCKEFFSKQKTAFETLKNKLTADVPEPSSGRETASPSDVHFTENGALSFFGSQLSVWQKVLFVLRGVYTGLNIAEIQDRIMMLEGIAEGSADAQRLNFNINATLSKRFKEENNWPLVRERLRGEYRYKIQDAEKI